jgi:hypothetical protein
LINKTKLQNRLRGVKDYGGVILRHLWTFSEIFGKKGKKSYFYLSSDQNKLKSG